MNPKRVLILGSGLAEFGFDIDTYQGAERLNTHLQALPAQLDNTWSWLWELA